MINAKTQPVAAIKEILTNHVSYMDEDALRSTLSIVVGNLNSHSPIGKVEHQMPYAVSLSGELLTQATVPSASATVPSASPEVSGYDEPFINVMHLEGDVLRNSGLCAVGSMDMKQYMMDQVDAGATAHIIIINSGGGNAYSVYDFKDMIDYAHEAGQPVLAFVRGYACSAAYALAMMCDKILCYSDHDIVGSIGCLCAVMVQSEDKENQYTFQTLRTVYAEKSTLKNHAYREAVKGNMEPYQQQADEMCEVFHDMCRHYRPCITEEQLSGDHYDSCDVVGTLVDETGVTFQRAVDVAIELVEDYRIAALKAGTTYR